MDEHEREILGSGCKLNIYTGVDRYTFASSLWSILLNMSELVKLFELAVWHWSVIYLHATFESGAGSLPKIKQYIYLFLFLANYTITTIWSFVSWYMQHIMQTCIPTRDCAGSFGSIQEPELMKPEFGVTSSHWIGSARRPKELICKHQTVLLHRIGWSLGGAGAPYEAIPNVPLIQLLSLFCRKRRKKIFGRTSVHLSTRLLSYASV